jgi:hypothetical protein
MEVRGKEKSYAKVEKQMPDGRSQSMTSKLWENEEPETRGISGSVGSHVPEMIANSFCHQSSSETLLICILSKSHDSMI